MQKKDPRLPHSLRAAAILAVLFFTIGIWIVRIEGTLSPGLSFGVFSALVAVLVSATRDTLTYRRYVAYLGIILMIAVAYRTVPILFVEGVIGIDPHWYTIQTQAVLEQGHTDVIDNPFYRDAPLYIILLSIASNTLGIHANISYVIMPLSIGIVLPAISAIIVTQIQSDSYQWALLAAGLTTLSPSSMRYAYWPIAQSLAIVFFASVLLLIIIHYRTERNFSERPALMTAIIVSIISLTFVHKLPMLIFTVFLVGLSVLHSVDVQGRFLPPAKSNKLPVIALVILTSVWMLVSQFGVEVFLTASTLISEGFAFGTITSNPHAAHPPINGMIAVLGRNAHWLVLVLGGGIGWTLLATRLYYSQLSKPQQGTASVTLLMLAILLGFLAIGIFGSSAEFNPVRMIFQSTFLLASIVAFAVSVVATQLHRYTDQQQQLIVLFIICVLLFTQFASIGALPDDDLTPRSYLTTGEINGKDFVQNQTNNSDITYTDSYFVRAEAYRYEREPGYWSQEHGSLQSYDEDVLNGRLPNDATMIAYRTNVDIYGHTPFPGHWVLKWNVEQRLDRCYNATYDNSHVRLFSGPRC